LAWARNATSTAANGNSGRRTNVSNGNLVSRFAGLGEQIAASLDLDDATA
jgi:hypothetical protein